MPKNNLTLIKQTRKVGTSAGVILPVSWMNKEVSVTLLNPSISKIMLDVNEILLEKNLNAEAKGIYLFGSYARGDFDYDSDVDILVITDNVNKIIRERNYEIILISESNFEKNLVKSLNLLSIIGEEKPLFNSRLIENYKKINLNKIDFSRFLSEIDKILSIDEDTVKTCEENNLKIPDGIVYSIVLRLRELYIIKGLIDKKPYKKGEFKKISGENPYNAYSRIRKNNSELNNSKYEEIIKLIDIGEKWLKELKKR